MWVKCVEPKMQKVCLWQLIRCVQVAATYQYIYMDSLQAAPASFIRENKWPIHGVQALTHL